MAYVNGLLDEQLTGPKGKAILRGSQGYSDSDLLRVQLENYKTHEESWPEETNPIRVKLREPRKPCTYTVQTIVRELGADGLTRCSAVYETKECPPGPPIFSYPTQPPPLGKRWRYVRGQNHGSTLKGTR